MGIAQKVSMGIASKVSAGIAPKGDRCCSCGWESLQRGIAPKVTLLQLSAGRAGRTRPRTRVCEVGAGDRLLIVTDGPYICPDPLRGHTAHPGHVHPVAEKIAEWQGKPVGDWLPCAAAPLRSTARGLPRLHTEPRGTGEEASQAGLPCRRALDSYNAGSALILLACLSAQRKGVFSSSHVAGRNILVTHPVSLLGRVPRQPMVHRTPRGWRRSFPHPVRLRVTSLGGEQVCALDWTRNGLLTLLQPQCQGTVLQLTRCLSGMCLVFPVP